MRISRNINLSLNSPGNMIRWFIGIGIVLLLIIFGIAGFSLLSMLLMVLLVALVIYFGSIGVLASSFVVGVLLKIMSSTLQTFTTIWWTGPTNERFFTLVNQAGYFEMVFLVFLLAYTLRFFTGSIKILHFQNSVDVKNKKEED